MTIKHNIASEIDQLFRTGEFLRIIEIFEQKISSTSGQFIDYCYLSIAYLLNDQSEEAELTLTSGFLLFEEVDLSHQSNILLQCLEFIIEQQMSLQNFANAQKLISAISHLFDEELSKFYLNKLEQEAELLRQQANLKKTSGDYSTAEKYYLKILEIFPENHQILYRLAETYYHQNRYVESQDAIIQALTVDESSSDYHYLLGLIAENNNNFTLAKQAYQSAIEKCPTHRNSYHRLLLIEQKYRNYPGIVELLHQAIKNLPNEVNFYYLLVIAHQENGEIALAEEIAEQAITSFPYNLSFKRLRQALLPIIYKNENEMALCRKDFIEKLDYLIKLIELDTQEKIDDAFQMLTSYTNFFLYYQNQNDVEILRKYGFLAQKITLTKYPQFYDFQAKPKNHNKIRIGYLSSRLDTIGNLFIGWLHHANLKYFEIYTYYLNYFSLKNDASVSNYHQASQKFYDFLNPDFETVCQTILNDNLDILVFLELGMEARLTPYGCVRLSPIQCVTWGHPITSGLPEIDYFLSSEAMESPVGEEHYTEKLIRLAGMGIICPQPEQVITPPSKKREYFSLSEEDCVYLCCQYFCKYLPLHDYLFSHISTQVSNAKFVFIERYNQAQKNTNIFRQRLQQAFAQQNLDCHDFCVFLPPLDLPSYYDLITLSDIFLDTLGWSGGVTTLDAIAHHLPIVTCPGELLRGRQSYGLLKTLGVTETIATDEQEYVQIAVRLGLDPQWRQNIRYQLQHNKNKLYQDQQGIRSLEDFYRSVIKTSL